VLVCAKRVFTRRILRTSVRLRSNLRWLAESRKLGWMEWSELGRRWCRASCVGILAFGALVSACSGSDEPARSAPGAGGSDSGAVGSAGASAESVKDLDGILAGEARGYCARLFRCAESSDEFGWSRVIVKTPAGCEAVLEDLNAKSTSIRDLRLRLNQGALQIVPAKAQACLDELSSCNGTSSLTRGSCRDMFEGKAALGTPCQRSEDCAGDAFCALTALCPGTCTARKAAGENCGSSQECSQGDGYTVCDASSNSQTTCRTLPLSSKATLGQPCTRRLAGAQSLSLCVDSLWCGPVAGQPSTATLGVCQQPIPAGGACSDNDDLCAEGACAASAGVCRAVTLLEHAGDSCDEAQFRICSPRLGLVCNEQAQCEATGDHTQGSVCSSADFQPTCNSGLLCRRSTAGGPATCQPLLETGASCQEAWSCESGACDGTCQERPCLG
jgi:hypothetical protein